MKIPSGLNLIEVRCKAKNKRGKQCGRFLGRFQYEGTNRYDDRICPVCKALTQIYIDEVGILHIESIRYTRLAGLKTPTVAAYVEG